MTRLLSLAALALLIPMLAAAEGCDDVSFDGARFTVCEIDLTQTEVDLFLYGQDGAPLGSFRAADRALQQEGARLGIAMNAGMYHPDRSPVGLYIEDGETLRGIVTSDGPGNFGLLPNGVLCLMEGSARIAESRVFAADPLPCADATQSGPMLVIDGDLHPRFLPDSDSRYVRNGVGVSDDGTTLWFAISAQPVNFHHFARLFRDGIGAPDALYLDGNVSRLYDSTTGRHDPGFPMGPMIGTVDR